MSSALCDAPSRWLDRRALNIDAGAGTLGATSAPSFAYGGGQTFVAFESAGHIWFARATGEEIARGVALVPTNFNVAGDVGEPDVHYDAVEARYTMYYANRDDGSIWRAYIGLEGTPQGAAEEWLAPGLDDAFIESIDGPSILRPAPDTSGPTYVFARITTTESDASRAATRIVRLVIGSEIAPTFEKPANWDDVTVRTTQPDFGAFDRDEVASPAAYRQNGSIQVAFAGRSGARWAIGLMATDDLQVALWRRAPAPTILTGRSTGFDSVSVRDPAVVTRGTNVELLFTGSDGASDAIGYAHREATNDLLGGP